MNFFLTFHYCIIRENRPYRDGSQEHGEILVRNHGEIFDCHVRKALIFKVEIDEFRPINALF